MPDSRRMHLDALRRLAQCAKPPAIPCAFRARPKWLCLAGTMEPGSLVAGFISEGLDDKVFDPCRGGSSQKKPAPQGGLGGAGLRHSMPMARGSARDSAGQ